MNVLDVVWKCGLISVLTSLSHTLQFLIFFPLQGLLERTDVMLQTAFLTARIFLAERLGQSLFVKPVNERAVRSGWLETLSPSE